MKKVIDLNKLEIIEINDNLYECSCCGNYHTIEKYMNKDEKQRSRTNCTDCYNTKYEKMLKIKENTKKVKVSRKYKDLQKKKQILEEVENYSMKVEDLIKELQKLPEGSKVAIEQEGYYCSSKFGDFTLPAKLNKEFDLYFIGCGGSGAYCWIINMKYSPLK